MNLERLRKRGWSEEEIGHVSRFFAEAELRHPPHHGLFWLLVLVLMTSAVAIAMELVPIIVLASPQVSMPLMFAVGACLGLLFVHALHDLRHELAHQHLGMLLLALFSLLFTTLILSRLQGRLAGGGSVLPLSLAFVLGLAIPYLAHWRVTRGSR